MPKPKKEEEVIVPVKKEREKIVELLKVELYKIFDRTPTGSLSETGLNNLIDKIYELQK